MAMLAEAQVLRRMMLAREMLSSMLVVTAPHAEAFITASILTELHSLLESTISVALRYSFFDPRLLRELQSLSWSAQACRSSHGQGSERKVQTFLPLARATVVTLDTRLAVMLQRNLSNVAIGVTYGLESRVLDLMLAPGSEDFYDPDHHHHLGTNEAEGDGETITAAGLLRNIQSGANAESLSVPSRVTANNGALLMLQPASLRTLLKLVDVRMMYDLTPLGKSTGAGGAGVPLLLHYNVMSHSISSSARARALLLEAFRLVAEGSDLHGAPSNGDEATRVAQTLLVTTARATFDIVRSLREHVKLPEGSNFEIDLKVPQESDKGRFDVTSTIIAAIAHHFTGLHLSSHLKEGGADPGIILLLQKCVEPTLHFLSDATNHQPLFGKG